LIEEIEVRELQQTASHLFGLEAEIYPMSGEQDLNFRLKDKSGDQYVLKLSDPSVDIRLLKLQNKALNFLDAGRTGPLSSVLFPRILPSRHGHKLEEVKIAGRYFRARLLTYLPGKPAAVVRPHSDRLLKELGSVLATVDSRLANLKIPAEAERDFQWDVRQAPRVIEEHLEFISDSGKRELVERLRDGLLPIVESRLDDLRLSLIHNDANDYNLLVSSPSPGSLAISGLIDFGDLAYTWTVAEPAIASTYMMMEKQDPVGAIASLAAGYNSVHKLNEAEIAVLFPLACLRAAISVSLSAYRSRINPDNEYLTISEAPAWRLLQKVDSIHPRLAEYRIRDACGLEPCPDSAPLRHWFLDNQKEFSPILPVDLTDPCQPVLNLGIESGAGEDFSENRPGKAPAGSGSRLFGLPESVSEIISGTGFKHALGRYDEPRLIRSGFRFSKADRELSEKRNIHLGIDIFVDPGTPVYAPFPGTVYFNSEDSAPLDYGPTLILEHHPDAASPFFTLYGHLAKGFPANVRAGQRIGSGEEIGRIGGSDENAGWPPHLHFQVITDILDRQEGFPGVSSPSQRNVWRSICPDPSPILGIPEKTLALPGEPAGKILDFRKRHMGRSLSVSYRQALKIVRGIGQYLFDSEGRQYLDCVNNVCHVGHSHPRVVRAGWQQAACLNTNTRYLHDSIVRYIRSLLSYFPDPLDTCFLVCSGSEANELALRLARAYTGSRHILALEGGYHGNTQALIDISSYKHDGPGGAGPPDWVKVLPIPDGYKGTYRGSGRAVGEAYAAFADDAIAEMETQGINPSAFICESIPGCGGQIVLPDGYLEKVYYSVRKSGGVNIADEVQTGFGRVGSHFWAYELQGVVPDIVTLGKPIGNGHPVGAVVTTSEIAEAFANGMEYFNTFGGNPVSCEAASAVLQVMEDENLQAHAGRVGEVLLDQLGRLKNEFEIVGDVRGRGLFLGVELVTNRDTREPAPEHADYVVNRLREWGFLLSTDGPSHNVIKIKPPLPFDSLNAEQLSGALEIALEELHSQE